MALDEVMIDTAVQMLAAGAIILLGAAHAFRLMRFI